MSVKVKNFGCRLNALEGDAVAEAARLGGIKNATVINGCAVTSEAMRQARQAARKARRTAPDDQIIVTGCAAQTDAGQFQAMPEVDLVLGNEEKLRAASYRGGNNAVGDIMRITHATPLPLSLSGVPQTGRTRAFVQVQTGCDHRCTFCIIPFGRGNSRSVPVADVVARCQALVASGHKEIVLTGVDVTSWGADIGEAGLGSLVRAILDRVPDLPRLRLSSIDAVEIDQSLLDMVICEPRLMPHLHLSLQAGDDMVLKRMKRRHTRADAIAFCQYLKTNRPDIVFGADLIAGFPTETDAMFENSLRLVTQCNLIWLHVFPYSPRPETPAARMPQVPGDVIKQRAAALRSAGEKQRRQWLAGQIGNRLNALVEKPGEARSAHFARILCPTNLAPGTLVDLKITGENGTALIGESAVESAVGLA